MYQPIFVTPRSIDVYIRRLPEKIEPDPQRPQYLKTLRGIGYRFELPKWVRLRSVNSPAGLAVEKGPTLWLPVLVELAPERNRQLSPEVMLWTPISHRTKSRDELS
jgi:hypothetical protein